MRSTIRAAAAGGAVAQGLEPDKLSVYRAIHFAALNGPLFQVLLVDGLHDKASAGFAEQAKLARFIAGKPFDRRGDEAEFFIALARVLYRLSQAREYMVPDADGRPLILPRDLHENVRWLPVFFLIPMQRDGEEIAVGILSAHHDNAYLRQGFFAHLTPRIGDEPIGGQLFQNTLQADPVLALDAEGAGDFPSANIMR